MMTSLALSRTSQSETDREVGQTDTTHKKGSSSYQ
jgi:hypothetical protein